MPTGKSSLPAAILFAGALLLSACDEAPKTENSPPPAPKISVAKPVVKKIIETDVFTGRFEAKEDVELRARVAGYLQEIHFKDGELVEAGDLLFTIDQKQFQAELENAQSSVEVAQSRLDLTKEEFERGQKLRTSGTIAASVQDQRRQEFLAAQAELAGATARLRTAQLNLGYTKIYSPVKGRIGRNLISIGNLVQANSTVLASIVSLDPIYFYFDVDERSYLAYSRLGRNGTRPSGRLTPYEVKIQLTDEDEPKHTGNLDFVNNRIDNATGTMRGRAIVTNTDLFLQPGLFGRISIPGSNEYEGVLVPDQAVGTDQNRRIVFVVGEKNVLTPTVIRPGPRIDGYRVVRTGLKGDETIVVNGLARVRPGMTIDPQVQELPPVAAKD
ncbi:MAG: efflux RND transporter periplasmic adaptor subunit [Anderseniella sp.]|nr:efflux RND transporter periplasmic adaptor subunit [Anderseniella sp.]